ncbi:probable chitinase 10 [Diaphorina citri]|uniref:chitinase n=1 Tax=Diaphorina citri TaxID=121845 RepID=A0A3Q0J7H4_DIACI|nr:probable chitinase 10 [Diaphorina citri]
MVLLLPAKTKASTATTYIGLDIPEDPDVLKKYNFGCGHTETRSDIRVKRGNSEKRVVCYYTNWSVYRPGTAKFTPQNINPNISNRNIRVKRGSSEKRVVCYYTNWSVYRPGTAKFTPQNKELREEFERESEKTGRSRLLLTMAVPAGLEYIDKGYDAKYVNDQKLGGIMFWSIDNDDSAKYVNDQKLGGIMFWSIDNDDFRGTCHGRPYPIIEAAKEALFGIDSELPSSTKSPSSKDSKVSTSTKRTRPKSTPSKSSVSKTTSTTTPESLTTPEPPTTPDPGSDFKCKDEGFFPHPRDCKKYFWCLDSGPSNLGIVAHQFTCPSDIRVRRGSSEKRVVCYYTNWSVYRPGTAKFTPQNINPYLCTHLIYAFGGLDKENGLRPFDKYQDIEQGGYAKFTGLKTYNKNLKTMLAIGGWNEGSRPKGRMSPLVTNPEKKIDFIRNVLKFLRVNHFDGLDLDWEYPAFRDGGKSADRENYAQLVQNNRVRLNTKEFSFSLTWLLNNYQIASISPYLDFMNILSYDYHSAFEPAVNHHSPLFPLEEDGEYNFEAQLSIDHTIKHYLKSGADPDKLVLGIPTYGRSYTLFNPESNQIGAPADGPGEQGDATREKGYLAYYEICSSLKSDDWSVEHPNPRAMGPYAFKGNQWVGYDDQEIAKDKAKYVNDQKLGGIMFWSIDNDDYKGKARSNKLPLMEIAKDKLLGGGLDFGLPSSTKSPSSKDSKVKSSVSKTTSTTTPDSLTTPEPPTTPDPGSDFKCKDEGFFPHPRDCKKYFWCLDSGPSNLGIVAHQFTCPSGLYFNKGADSCDFARNVLCKIKTASTPAPSKAPITLATAKTTFNRKEPSTTSTTTSTTTTTTEAPIEEEEEVEEALSEDPQTIKQLIDLIKKLGKVEEVEEALSEDPQTIKQLIDLIKKLGNY